VLVLEDDYYLADDTAKALEEAGATVHGPFSDAADAIAFADREKPGCAVVDVNLGRGPNFAPARALLARGVSIIFVTGYDGEVIPEDLRTVPCLQKPVSEARLLSAVGSACRA
jgi:FixJ family two-component response regulator